MVKFGNDSKGLLFTLTPASQLYPMHLDNLPLKPGKDLDDKIHARFPLYHGLLPASGSTDDGICQMLEEMLAEKGAKATVKASSHQRPWPQKDYGDELYDHRAAGAHRSNPAGRRFARHAGQGRILSSMARPETSSIRRTRPSGSERSFEDLYQDQGYAAVKVEVSEIDPPVVSDAAIEIPFSVTVTEGGVYKLGTINYPADALASRAEVGKFLAKYQAGSGRPLDQFLLAVNDAYHARGYLDCSVVSHASFNEATHIVNYSIEIDPGPLYQMGTVQFDGAPDAMAVKAQKCLETRARRDIRRELRFRFRGPGAKEGQACCQSGCNRSSSHFDEKPDPDTHQVNAIFHFAKAAQGGR